MNIMLISVGFFFFWENVGVTVGNPRSPWCAMALSDIYDDVRVSEGPNMPMTLFFLMCSKKC